MQPTSLTRVRVRDVPLDELVHLYTGWVLGQGEFRTYRRRRLDLGVPDALGVDDLFLGGDFGDVACRVQTRCRDDRWLLHWTHGDDRDDRVWHNIVRLQAEDGRVRVEHLAGFQASAELPSEAATPKTTQWLLEHHARRLEPPGLLAGGVTPIDARAVDGFVGHFLVDKAREAPIVVVTTDERGALVDPSDVAKRLIGTALVVRLEGKDASWGLRTALEVRGFPADLACFGGAVRLYAPGLVRDGVEVFDHPLLLSHRLEAVPANKRGQRVAAWVCQALARDLQPEEWLAAVVAFDLDEQQRRAQRLVVETAPVRDVVDEIEAIRTALVERDAQVAALRAQLEEANALFHTASDELTAASRRVAAITRERDRLEQERDVAREAASEAETELAEAHAIASAVDALRLASKAYPDELVILDSATSSAETSAFRQPSLLFKVLSVLAITGGGRTLSVHDTLTATCGKQARWKPKDSPHTLAAWGGDRDFVSSTGERVRYDQHVTLGHGIRMGTSMQVYYRLLDDGRVEIAHAGTHLRTVSHDS